MSPDTQPSGLAKHQEWQLRIRDILLFLDHEGHGLNLHGRRWFDPSALPPTEWERGGSLHLYYTIDPVAQGNKRIVFHYLYWPTALTDTNVKPHVRLLDRNVHEADLTPSVETELRRIAADVLAELSSGT